MRTSSRRTTRVRILFAHVTIVNARANCAANTSRRTTPIRLLIMQFLSGIHDPERQEHLLLVETDPLQQILESLVGANIVESGVYFQEVHVGVVFLVCAVQPVQGLLFLA